MRFVVLLNQEGNNHYVQRELIDVVVQLVVLTVYENDIVDKDYVLMFDNVEQFVMMCSHLFVEHDVDQWV